jgi:hypothetical protein
MREGLFDERGEEALFICMLSLVNSICDVKLNVILQGYAGTQAAR